MTIVRAMLFSCGVLPLVACEPARAPIAMEGAVVKTTGSAQQLNALVDARCEEITGGGTTVLFTPALTCPGCSAAGPENAIDGADATFASLTIPALQQGPAALRATAQDGLVFPGGNFAGITLSAPQSEQHLKVTIRTYLDGALQEQDCGKGMTLDVTEQVRNVYGIVATQPFDAVEIALQRYHATALDTECGQFEVLVINNPDALTRALEFRAHEFCSDFRL